MNVFSVLVIDDEESQLQSLKSFLTKRGFTVYTANNGEAGYKIAQSNLIDIVLTDFNMPGWDGMQVTSENERVEF